MKTTYTCHNVEGHPSDSDDVGHPHEFEVAFYPARKGDRDNPPTGAEVEPCECPLCGALIDVDDLAERLADEHEAGVEDAAEARREMDWERAR